MADPDPAFRAFAQAMCDGLARKHRLGLSDEDMRREMLARFSAVAERPAAGVDTVQPTDGPDGPA